MDELRGQAFRILKPPCVELSQAALKFKTRRISGKELVSIIEKLDAVLQTLSRDTNALDAKLADYVFFPLSHIFQGVKDVPIRVTEIALGILQILFLHGWRASISPNMGKQFVILLCFLAGGSATQPKVREVPEDLSAVAFGCLAALLQNCGIDDLMPEAPVGKENAPILGHSVTVILDGITEGPTAKVRLAALAALRTLLQSTQDLEALRSVLPGVVSALTKSLTPKGTSKVPFKVVAEGLNVLALILHKTLGDDVVFRGEERAHNSTSFANLETMPPDAWVTATSSQVKMALANLLPLRYHQKLEVKNGLLNLCSTIIRHCPRSLHQSIAMLVETLVILHSLSDGAQSPLTSDEGQVSANKVPLYDSLKGSLHSWIVALPRIIGSNDDTAKIQSMNQICTAFDILELHHTNLDILTSLLFENLQAGISLAIYESATNIINDVAKDNRQISQILLSVDRDSTCLLFRPVLFCHSSNRATASGLQTMIQKVKNHPAMASLWQKIIPDIYNGTGNDRLATLWLFIELSKNVPTGRDMLERYETEPLLMQSPPLDAIYAFAVEVLSKSTFSASDSWQVQALCLEAIALQSERQGSSFRPELVDVLYPVLERMGSHEASLQQHAMTCLNIVSQACAYDNPASLIVENADYLVNAVALKLNTFDISPQAPQVLVMMISLSGSALIPYLDDLIESIFSILSCYHGYPRLVESMFEVLNAVVEEASKSSVHFIKSLKYQTGAGSDASRSTDTADVASLLRSKKSIASRSLSSPSFSLPSSPQGSFKDAVGGHLETDADSEKPEELRPADSPPPKSTKTVHILTSIAKLAPAHITTPSPGLRARILDLLTTSFPMLARDTDTFLPIAATLWPYLTTRLFSDSEPYITVSAAKALTCLCSCAGSFLASRVDDHWEKLKGLYEKTFLEMREEMIGQKGAKSTRWRVWDTTLDLIIVLITDVGISEEREDAAFEILGPLIMKKAGLDEVRERDVRQCLKRLNADQVWLLDRRNEGSDLMEMPRSLQGMKVTETSR